MVLVVSEKEQRRPWYTQFRLKHIWESENCALITTVFLATDLFDNFVHSSLKVTVENVMRSVCPPLSKILRHYMYAAAVASQFYHTV